MSSLAPGWGTSVSQHLRATEKILQGVISNAEYVPSVETRRVGRLILKFAGSRVPWIQLRLIEPTKWMRGLQLIRDVFYLGRNSRARRLRGPPPDSRLEKHARTDQQDPSRNPRPHSRLCGYARQRRMRHRTDSCMPCLEGGFRVTVFLVVRF